MVNVAIRSRGIFIWSEKYKPDLFMNAGKYVTTRGIFQLKSYFISYKNILVVPWFIIMCIFCLYCPLMHLLLCLHAINNYVKTFLHLKLPSVSKTDSKLTSPDWSTVVTF